MHAGTTLDVNGVWEGRISSLYRGFQFGHKVPSARIEVVTSLVTRVGLRAKRKHSSMPHHPRMETLALTLARLITNERIHEPGEPESALPCPACYPNKNH